MSELVVTYKWQEQDITLTKDDIRNLISTSPNVTDKEILLFMKLCQYQQLNPFIREAYLIKYGTSPASMVTGVEVFTKRAETNPDFNGVVRSNNYDETEERSRWWSQVDVYRKNLEKPITTRVYYEEYVGTNNAGQVTKMWRTKARTMLDKVALMQGLRLAFPTALGGLYEEHELDHKEEVKDEQPKPKEEETIKEEEPKVVEAEIVKEIDEKQEEFIKMALLNNILNEEEKEKVRKLVKDGLNYDEAEAIITRYKSIKGEREKKIELVDKILKYKKDNFVHAPLIYKWAKIDKLEDLNGLTEEVLEEVLEKTKEFKKE